MDKLVVADGEDRRRKTAWPGGFRGRGHPSDVQYFSQLSLEYAEPERSEQVGHPGDDKVP